MLARNHGHERALQYGAVPWVSECFNNEVVNHTECSLRRLFVALHNFTRVDAESQKLLRLRQQLARKGDHQVGSVAHLLLLHLCSHGQHFGGGVRNFQLSHDRCRIRRDKYFLKVVHYELVHSVGAETGARDSSELFARFDVAHDRLLEPREVLVALLEQRCEAVGHPHLHFARHLWAATKKAYDSRG